MTWRRSTAALLGHLTRSLGSSLPKILRTRSPHFCCNLPIKNDIKKSGYSNLIDQIVKLWIGRVLSKWSEYPAELFGRDLSISVFVKKIKNGSDLFNCIFFQLKMVKNKFFCDNLSYKARFSRHLLDIITLFLLFSRKISKFQVILLSQRDWYFTPVLQKSYVAKLRRD